MLSHINKEVTSFLLKGKIQVDDPSNVRQHQNRRIVEKTKESRNENELGNANEGAHTNTQENEQKVQTYVRTEQKIGRNDPCPCGSGKKYKHCHGE